MEIVKKEPKPFFSLFRANKKSFNEVLCNSPGTSRSDDSNLDSNTHSQSNNRMNDDSNDDCIMIGDSVPLPLDSTEDDLTKQDDDTISNDIPFTNTVSLAVS